MENIKLKEIIKIEEDYEFILEGTIYEFNLDLLTKSLTLRVYKQEYNPAKKSANEKQKIILKYYELKLIDIKKLNFEDRSSISPSNVIIEDISVHKVNNDEYELGIGVVLLNLEIRCRSIELVELFRNEMDYSKAYEF